MILLHVRDCLRDFICAYMHLQVYANFRDRTAYVYVCLVCVCVCVQELLSE